MSVYVSGMVWKHSRAQGNTLLVLLALAEIAGEDGVARPQWDTSIARLAAMARCSPRAVQYALRELEGVDQTIAGQKRPGLRPAELVVSHGRGSSTYRILLDRNHQLFDGPAEAVDNPKKSREKPAADEGGGVQGLAPGGCKVEQLGVQALAPNPSSRLSRQSIPPAGEKQPVDKKVGKSKSMPTWITEWFERGLSNDLRLWARGKGIEQFLDLHFEKFRDYMAQERSWKRYTDLDAAFRTCARDDWGEVRKRAQMDAQFGRGVDLNSWWRSADGVKAKGFAIGLGWTTAGYRTRAIAWFEGRGTPTEQQIASTAWRMYEIEVLDTVVDREGWGAWVDHERRSAEFEAVCRRRRARGAEVPETYREATDAR